MAHRGLLGLATILDQRIEGCGCLVRLCGLVPAILQQLHQPATPVDARLAIVYYLPVG